MLTETKLPTLVVRGRESNMLDAATLTKVKEMNPRAATVELAGGHDLPGENPDGLARAVGKFLMESNL
jgi:pimeloyl-ACP methyl ester carboxylesterase